MAAKIVSLFSPADPQIKDIDFSGSDISGEARGLRDLLNPFFPVEAGFNGIAKLNYIDGVRITFENGDVVHVRPSGNADELRVYAVADSQQRAEHIAELAILEPDGILRQLEKSLN